MSAATRWFIDLGYVRETTPHGVRLDLIASKRLLEEILGSARGFIFDGVDPRSGITRSRRKFYDYMRFHGFQIDTRRLRVDSSGVGHQKEVDVSMALSMFSQASEESVNTVVLTSGDRDFVPAVQRIHRNSSVRVVLFAFQRGLSVDLVAEVDEVLYIDGELGRVGYSGSAA